MHHRESPPTPRDQRGTACQERGLTSVSFVGSYPAADFATHPPLPEVAFLGRSNVGKSSLLNALVGRRSLAHTSKTPGKTRLCNVYAVDQGFYLVDLPGYGWARVSQSQRRGFSQLLREYLTQRPRLAGVVWLLDVRRDPSPQDLDMADLLSRRGVPVLVAVTKADKVGRGQRREKVDSILGAVRVPADQCVVTSAKSREGIQDLTEAVAGLVTGTDRDVHEEG